MAIVSNEYFNNPIDAAETIRAVIASDAEETDLVRLRGVLVKTSEGKFACMASVFDIAPVMSVEDKSDFTMDYGKVRLAQKFFPVAELVSLFSEVCNKGLSLTGFDDLLSGPPVRAEVLFQQTDFARNAVPFFEVRLQEVLRRNWNYDSGPLVNPKLPYFSDVAHAVRTWCHYNNFDSMSDQRVGQIIFRLPRRMRRFVSMEVDADSRQLHIHIRFPEDDNTPLWLKGVWGVPGGTLQITRAVEELVTLEIPSEVHSIELLLVDIRGRILDYFTDSQRWGLTPAGLFYQLRYVKGSPNDIEKALAMGEGKTVEFKPFVIVGDKKKFNELVETVVAFLNTDGGILFVGIDDHCQLVGFRDKLKKEYKGDAADEAALKERYVGDLKQSFGAAIGKAVQLGYMWVDFKGEAVLQISVPKGESTPYWVSADMRRDIFVRRGSSNVTPDPELELPRLIGTGGLENPFGPTGL